MHSEYNSYALDNTFRIIGQRTFLHNNFSGVPRKHIRLAGKANERPHVGALKRMSLRHDHNHWLRLFVDEELGQSGRNRLDGGIRWIRDFDSLDPEIVYPYLGRERPQNGCPYSVCWLQSIAGWVYSACSRMN